MTELNYELEIIKRMQFDVDELKVVSSCESINELTPSSKFCRLLGRYPLLLLLISLAIITAFVYFGNAQPDNRFHEASTFAPLLVLVLIFCREFYLWIIIKKLSWRIKSLEKKLDEARQALK